MPITLPFSSNIRSFLLRALCTIHQTLVMFTQLIQSTNVFAPPRNVRVKARRDWAYCLDWFSCFELEVSSTRHREKQVLLGMWRGLEMDLWISSWDFSYRSRRIDWLRKLARIAIAIEIIWFWCETAM